MSGRRPEADDGVRETGTFDRAMEVSEITGLKSIEADAATFDYSTIAPIAFCLLDVDLYVPIAKALPRIYHHLVRAASSSLTIAPPSRRGMGRCRPIPSVAGP